MRISPLSSAVLSAALLTGAVACGKSEPKLNVEQAPAGAPATAAPAAAPQQAQAMPPSTAPAGAPAGMMSGHAGAAPAAMPGLASLNGTVVETMDSGGYTYMRLKLAEGGETWAAVNKSPVKKGDKVAVVNAMPMDGFESKTLGRKFDRIMFGQLAGGAAPAGAAPAGMGGVPSPAESQQMAQQHAGISSAPDPGKVDVPKAEGADARRVAEVFAQKAQLDGKSVTIRGKVVKFTPGVMGRNWIHLRDGSGTAEAKDHDITVTTNDAAAIGDVVVVKGKVGVGRDFGMGYSYPVLIEEAKVTK